MKTHDVRNAIERMTHEELHELTNSLSQAVLWSLAAACSAAGATTEVHIAQCPRGCGKGLFIDIDEFGKKLQLNCPTSGHGPWKIGDIK